MREAVGRLREQLAQASALTRAGRYTEPRALARQVVDAARPLKSPPLEAEALFARGRVLRPRGRAPLGMAGARGGGLTA